MPRSEQESFKLSIRAAARLAKIIAPCSANSFGKRLHRPVFMVGCGRSGTSLLTSILSSHPSVAVFPNEANDLWHPDLYPWHESKMGLPPIWVDPHGFTKHSLEQIDWPKIRAVFGAFQCLTRRPVFLNKSVMLSFMLKDVARQFEEARFIHVIRDGRSVALSYARKNLRKIRQNREAYATVGITDDMESLIYRSFDHWVEHIDAIELADREEGLTTSGRFLELPYETLTQDPEGCIGQVVDFIGLPDRNASVSEQIVSRNYKVVEEMPAAIRNGLSDRGATILERKGYTA